MQETPDFWEGSIDLFLQSVRQGEKEAVQSCCLSDGANSPRLAKQDQNGFRRAAFPFPDDAP